MRAAQVPPTPEDALIFVRSHRAARAIGHMMLGDRDDAAICRIIAFRRKEERRQDAERESSGYIKWQRHYFRAPDCEAPVETESRANGWHP